MPRVAPLPARDGHVRVPRQDRSRQSLERIVEATIALLRERSYDQVTLAEICQRSGVSIGALYGRVGGKDELLRAVQERFLEGLALRFEERAAAIARHAHGLAEVVPAVVAALGTLLDENAGVLRAFMLHSATDTVIQAQGRRSAQRTHATFSALLLACSAEIGHPQPERAVAAGLLVVYAAQARFLGLDSSGGRADGEWTELLQDLGDMMLAYLAGVEK